MREAKATRLKVLDTGIWKCRFRPFGGATITDVRSRSSSELVQELSALVQKRTAAREAAKAARDEARRVRREEIAKAKAELRGLGATRVKIRAAGDGAYRWTCQHRARSTGTVREFDEATAGELVGAVRAYVQALGGRAA